MCDTSFGEGETGMIQEGDALQDVLLHLIQQLRTWVVCLRLTMHAHRPITRAYGNRPQNYIPLGRRSESRHNGSEAPASFPNNITAAPPGYFHHTPIELKVASVRPVKTRHAQGQPSDSIAYVSAHPRDGRIGRSDSLESLRILRREFAENCLRRDSAGFIHPVCQIDRR